MSSQRQPQWSVAAGGPRAQPAAPTPAPVAVTAASVDMTQLASEPVDIKRWINNAVRHQVEEMKAQMPSDSAATSTATAAPALEEQAVSKLFSRTQAHAQQVGSTVEELISQAVVRLPRAAMELQRMIAEANELSVQLQATRDVVKPVVEARSQGHTQRLAELRGTQARLRRCLSILEKGLAVDSSTARIAQAIQQLQKEQGSRQPASPEGRRHSAATAADGGPGAGIGPSSSSSSRVNVAELSMSIRAVRRDLQELQAVDPSYGEQHRVALAEHERVIEQVLEHECLAYLAGHDATRAAELLRPLHVIGRDTVVLQGYAKLVTADCIAVLKEALSVDGGLAREATLEGYGGVPSVLSAAQAAKALKERVVPVTRATLESELNFLFLLSECMGDNFGGGGGETAEQKKKRDNASASVAETALADTAGERPSDRDGTGSQLHAAMTLLTDSIGAAFQSLMAPILDNAQHNTDVIACYDATRSIKVSPGDASASAVAGREGGDNAAGGSTTTRLGVRDRATLQASSQALNAFIAVFQRDTVLEGFCQRTAARLATAAGAPDEAAGDGSNNRSSHQDAALLLLLQNHHVRQELTAALLDGAREVLHFLPEQTLSRCVPRWSRSLTSLFRMLFPSTPAAPAIHAASSKTEPAAAAIALVKLSVIVKCAKPTVEAMRKEVSALLTSAEVQASYPSSANAALSTLGTAIWSPLLSRLDSAAAEAQQTAKESILSGILATVEHYDRLPVWGGVGSQHAPADAGHARVPLVSYQPGHVTPSEAVREFGEAVMGTPLALESLRDEVGSVEGLLAELFLPSSAAGGSGGGGPRGKASVSSAFASTVKSGVEELLDDRSAAWLDDIVRAAVDAFVEDKISAVRVDLRPSAAARMPPSSAAAGAAASSSSEEEALKRVSQAWEQLSADLEYIRNVLSAVSEEQYDALERCLKAVQSLPPPTSSEPFVIGEKLRQERKT